MAKGLQYCHANDIVHCDLKPDNILLNLSSDNKIVDLKLADFGFAFKASIDRKSGDDSRGTLIYSAPEMLWEDEKFGSKVDTWSLGVILHEMLSG